MPEVPQGVAQRVIEQAYQKHQTEWVGSHSLLLRIRGMKHMHREFSAEARRVLLENEDALEQARSSKDAAEHRRLVTRRLTLISTFQRLGLDLEPEVSDE